MRNPDRRGGRLDKASKFAEKKPENHDLSVRAAMPIYDFSCKHCEHEFEDLVLGHGEPECPRCHSLELERRPSAFAVGHRDTRDPSPATCGTCGGVPGSCMLD